MRPPTPPIPSSVFEEYTLHRVNMNSFKKIENRRFEKIALILIFILGFFIFILPMLTKIEKKLILVPKENIKPVENIYEEVNIINNKEINIENKGDSKLVVNQFNKDVYLVKESSVEKGLLFDKTKNYIYISKNKNCLAPFTNKGEYCEYIGKKGE